MGAFSQIASISRSGLIRGDAGSDYTRAFYAGDPLPDVWLSSLSAAGVPVTPDLALTLSAWYGGVTTIGMDLATLPLQVFKLLDDGGKDRVRPNSGIAFGSGGIAHLAYALKWQPNGYQSAAEFWLSLIVQYLQRSVCYAEIVPDPTTGFLGALLPRHPDRVKAERLPSGEPRYRLSGEPGGARYLTKDEMFVVRDLTMGGELNPVSRVQYATSALGSAIAARDAQAKFFKSGMTAAKIATYKGEMEEEDEAALHKSISRFAAGVENSFGLALVPDDVTITNLGVEPEKAQMMLAQEWGIREVARFLRMPGHKLGIKDSVAYASQVQAAVDYVISTLRPIAVLFESAVHNQLILQRDFYLAEWKLEALLRGDPEAQAKYLALLIEKRVMRPSEARLLLNMNPDADLDRLSEGDMRPGQAGGQPAQTSKPADATGRALLRGMQAILDNAAACLRRERQNVEKLARKHADDVPAWHASLREFYGDHAQFVARLMRVSPDVARGYCAEHGSAIEMKGTPLLTDEWERYESSELAALAVEPERMAA